MKYDVLAVAIAGVVVVILLRPFPGAGLWLFPAAAAASALISSRVQASLFSRTVARTTLATMFLGLLASFLAWGGAAAGFVKVLVQGWYAGPIALPLLLLTLMTTSRPLFAPEIFELSTVLSFAATVAFFEMPSDTMEVREPVLLAWMVVVGSGFLARISQARMSDGFLAISALLQPIGVVAVVWLIAVAVQSVRMTVAVHFLWDYLCVAIAFPISFGLLPAVLMRRRSVTS